MAAGGRNVDALMREYQEFLESDDHDGRYIEKLKQCITDKKFRLVVNVNDLRNFSEDLTSELMKKPREHMMALRMAATESAQNADPSVAKILKLHELQAGFEGNFGLNLVSPRGLLSTFLNNLVEVEGIVTKVSSVKPKLVRSVQFCPETGEYKVMEHRDDTAADIGIEVRGRVRLPTTGALAKEDSDGNALELEQGLSTYKDYQTIVLQEMPERAKVGQLPRSIELILEYDLVDKVKPGDRVQCVGVYQPLAAPMAQGQFSGLFKPILICNNISVIGKEVGAVLLTGSDVKNIKEVASRDTVLDIMARSLCPSIYGHEFIKKALVLQLLGGCERNLDNGTHLRGDINVMMVGDPSTAKSQLLRAVLDIAPLAISTTGRGSSGVGLTAAVTMDSETGEKRLEAGAMVLADRGVVCIDEFDKMGENDRVAIHEVMEQQTVTIAKAGIHASLNARCSVLAAANPVYDQLDPVLDRQLSVHVIRSHQYRRPGTIMEPEQLNQTCTLNLDDSAEAAIDTQVWQRGGRTGAVASKGDGRAGDTLTKEFLRKYIHYAKSRVHPVLSDTAMEGISAAYVSMRSKQNQKNLPVTARSLETLIRLSSANAKARLSSSVDDEDVETAIELMNFVLFHEIGNTSVGPSNGVDSRGNLMGEEQNGRRARGVATSLVGDEKSKRARHEHDSVGEAADEENLQESDTSSSTLPPKLANVDRIQFLGIISNFVTRFSDEGDECPIVDLLVHLQSNEQDMYARLYSPSFTELVVILSEFEIENQVMISSKEVNGEIIQTIMIL